LDGAVGIEVVYVTDRLGLELLRPVFSDPNDSNHLNDVIIQAGPTEERDQGRRINRV
jgi:hypothetical protein